MSFIGKAVEGLGKLVGIGGSKTPTLVNPNTDQETQARIEEQARNRLRGQQGAAANILFNEEDEAEEEQKRRRSLGGF